MFRSLFRRFRGRSAESTPRRPANTSPPTRRRTSSFTRPAGTPPASPTSKAVALAQTQPVQTPPGSPRKVPDSPPARPAKAAVLRRKPSGGYDETGRFPMMQRLKYIRSSTTGGELVDTVQCRRLTPTDQALLDLVEKEDRDLTRASGDNHSYNWKRVTLPADKLSLFESEGLFEAAECFVVRLDHGDGFVEGALMMGSSCGFLCTVCVRNEGIAGLAVPGTHHVSQQLERGDMLVSRAARGVQMFPQVGGSALFLIVSVVPSSDLLASGITIGSPTLPSGSMTASKTVATRRQAAVRCVDEILKLRQKVETRYTDACLLSELCVVYTERYAGRVDESMRADIEMVKRYMDALIALASARDYTYAERRERNIHFARKRSLALAHLEGMRDNYSVTTETAKPALPNSVQGYMEEDIAETRDGMLDLWEEIRRLVSNLESLLPGCSESVDRFVLERARRCESARSRLALADRLRFLSGVGIHAESPLPPTNLDNK
ncbi:conserved hypothetical pox protein [Squirrelpox virus]|uniref:A4L n=1 Tax=Squirrelpox virus TaxID=240426 RepID=Q1HTU0_9POXV|nr:conserved hypothetical pox protein [Squirrelpox virus]ABD51446.1 A4L [Squirrelpox virus]CCD83195.1 conserved hypothetical pox protein [Squirrelpox virus]